MPVRIERKKPRIQLLPLLTSTNPSKNYVFNLLYTFIQEQRPACSLDAGSGDLRNRWMFPGEYFGITMERDGYQRGVEKMKLHPIKQSGSTTVYLMRLENDFSFVGPMDLAVCTHTISYVADRVDVMARLAGSVRAGGALFLTGSITEPNQTTKVGTVSGPEEALSVLEPLFDDVLLIYYFAEGIGEEMKDAPDQVLGLTTLEMNLPNDIEGHGRFCIMARGKKTPALPQSSAPPMLEENGLMIVDRDLMVAGRVW